MTQSPLLEGKISFCVCDLPGIPDEGYYFAFRPPSDIRCDNRIFPKTGYYKCLCLLVNNMLMWNILQISNLYNKFHPKLITSKLVIQVQFLNKVKLIERANQKLWDCSCSCHQIYLIVSANSATNVWGEFQESCSGMDLKMVHHEKIHHEYCVSCKTVYTLTISDSLSLTLTPLISLSVYTHTVC